MLMNLLPGLRELRGPLATGYILICAVFVAFSGTILHADRSGTGVVRDIATAVTSFGAGSALAILSFVAYLAGTIWLETVPRPLRRLRRVAAEAAGSVVAARELAVIEDIVVETVRQAVIDKADFRTEFRSRAGSGRDDDKLATTVDVNRHAFLVRQELETLPTRLLGTEAAVWEAWDRLRTEGEFRDAVATALPLVCAALAWRVSWWWVLVAAASVVLWRMATRKYDEARALLIEAVRAGRLTLPELERVGDAQRVQWTGPRRAASSGSSG
jgi:hypothetical protein